MQSRKRKAKQRQEKKRRVSIPLAVCLVLVAVTFAGVTAIKVHAAWMLPQAVTGWNQKQLARFDHNTMNYKFAVVADTHDSSMAFGRIKEKIENGGYLFAIDVGDMSIDAGVVKTRIFLNQVDTMKTPMLTAVGNHDIAAGGYANYKKIFGQRYYSFTVGRCLFLVLDDAAGKKIDDKQMEWFKNELKTKAKEFPTQFVFMHVPTFRGRRDLKLPMQKFVQDRANAQEFKQICMDYRINIVFSGHCHTFDYDIWPGDVHYVVTGGGGGRLWDVEEFRGMYHYMDVQVEGEHGAFELEPIRQNSLHFTYQYLEEPWVYIYAYVAVHYFWLMVPGLALLGLLVFLFVRRWRKSGVEPPAPDSS
jgi:hypothetical protein